MIQKFDVHLHGDYDPKCQEVVQKSGIVALFNHCGMDLSYSRSDIFAMCGKDIQAINNGFFDIFPNDFHSADPDIVRFTLLPKYFSEIFPLEGINTPFCILDDHGHNRFSKGWNKAFGCSLLGHRVHHVILQAPYVVGEKITDDDHFADILQMIDPAAKRNHILLDFQEHNRPEIHVLEKVQDVGHWHRDWTKHNQFYLDNAATNPQRIAVNRSIDSDLEIAQMHDCQTFDELIAFHKTAGVDATVFIDPSVTVTKNFLSIARMEISTQQLAGKVFSDSPYDLKANRFAAVFDASNTLAIFSPVYYPTAKREIRYQ